VYDPRVDEDGVNGPETLVASRSGIWLRIGGMVAIAVYLYLRTDLAIALGLLVLALGAALAFVTTSLVIDEHGLRFIRLLPFIRPKVVAWTDVSRFDISAGRRSRYVGYWHKGKEARSWYPAGWPARSSIAPNFSRARGQQPLTADALCTLLRERHTRAMSA